MGNIVLRTKTQRELCVGSRECILYMYMYIRIAQFVVETHGGRWKNQKYGSVGSRMDLKYYVMERYSK